MAAGRGEQIGEGYVKLSVDHDIDRDMANANREFEQGMREMGRKKATAKIGVDISELKSGLKDSNRILSQWGSLIEDLEEAHKSLAGAEKGASTRRIKSLRDQMLQEEKLNAEIRERLGLAQESLRIAKNAAVEETAANRRIALYNRLAAAQEQIMRRANAARDKQFILAGRQFMADEARAEAMRKEIQQVPQLQKRYSDLEQQLIKLEKAANRFTISGVEKSGLLIQARAISSAMDELKVRIERTGEEVIHFDRNVDLGAQTLSRWVANLTEASVRIGPFTTSVGTAIKMGTLLSPIIVGLAGAFGALAAATGAGLIGGVGLGAAALAGFIPLVGGLVAAIRPIAADYKVASQAADAYSKEVLKSGENSEKAKEKYKTLQKVLKNMDPSARKAFESFAKLRTEWDKSVAAPAEKAMGSILNSGTTALSKLVSGPNGIAAMTVKSLGILDKELGSIFERMSSGKGRGILGNLMGNFNEMLGPMLRGLANLGAATGKWLSAFSDHLPGIMSTFERWSDRVNQSADNTNKLGSRVGKLVKASKDLGVFLAGATRWLSAFFGAGVGPGSSFLRDMGEDLTRFSMTMDRSNIREFFSDSIEMTKNFSAAIAPLAKLFFEFATILGPVAKIMLEVASALGKIVAELAAFGPVKALIQGAFAIFIGGTVLSKVRQMVEAFTALRTAMLAAGAAGTAARLGTVVGAGTGMTGIGGRAADARARALAKRGFDKPDMDLNEKNFAKSASAATKFKVSAAAALTAATGFGPAGLAIAAGATAAAFGIMKLSQHVSAYEKASRRATDAAKQSQQAMMESAEINTQLAGSAINNAAAQRELRAAEKDLNSLRRSGKASADELSAAEDRVSLARINASATAKQVVQEHAQAVAANFKIVNKATEAAVKQKESVERLSQKVRDATNATGDQNLSMTELIAKYRSADPSKLTMEQDFLRKGILKLIPEMEKLTMLKKDMRKAEDAYAVATANSARAMNRMVELTGKSAAATAKLARAGGQKVATAVASTFTDPKDAGAAAKAATQAIRGGTSRQVIIEVVTKSKNAEAALLKLNALAAGVKKAEIDVITKGGPKAVKELERINGKKIEGKNVQIAERGGRAALRMIDLVRAQKIQDKEFTLRAKIDSSFQSAVQSIRNFMGMPSTKTVSVQGGGGGGGSRPRTPVNPRVYGFSGRSAKDTMVERALMKAEMRGARQSTGGKFSRPSLLVGEENRPEYVIATNPAYRQRNENYLKAAAAEFGFGLVRSAYSGRVPTGRFQTGGFDGSSFFADLGNTPGALGGSRNSKKQARSYTTGSRSFSFGRGKGKRKMKLYNTDSPYYGRIKTLDQQKEDLEREYGIQESKLQQPDSFMKEVGVDENGDPILEVDKDKVQAWRNALAPLATLRKKILDVTRALSLTAQRAKGPTKSKIQRHQANIKALKAQIKKDEKIRNNKKAGQQSRLAAGRRLTALNQRLQREETQLGNIQGFAKDLPGIAKDAGFEVREQEVLLGNIQTEMGSGLDKTVADENLAANPPEKKGKSDNADTQAQIAQLERNNAIVSGNAAANLAALRTFRSSGDIGSGGFTNAFAAGISQGEKLTNSQLGGSYRPSGDTIINVNTLHPGDPQTLGAIASAATAGMGQQSYIPNSNMSVGY